jgi:hypothetical protein
MAVADGGIDEFDAVVSGHRRMKWSNEAMECLFGLPEPQHSNPSVLHRSNLF